MVEIRIESERVAAPLHVSSLLFRNPEMYFTGAHIVHIIIIIVSLLYLVVSCFRYPVLRTL